MAYQHPVTDTMSPPALLLQTMAAGDEVPTRWMVGAVAADVVAVVRLWALAGARRKGAKEAAQAAATAKAAEAKSD